MNPLLISSIYGNSISEEDMELTTKQGVDKLRLMLHCMSVIEFKSEKQTTKAIDKLKSFLVQQLKRGITPQENIDLLEAIRQYIISDPETNERTSAMNNLFNLKFIN